MSSYDRRLARSVYAMVLLAVLALVLAEGTVVYLALACLAALISWPIAHGQSGQGAAPRWLVSLAVLLALLFFTFELANSVPLVAALAHFMIFVQVCKFFESKRARDYGQLIVLSMLEMVVAAILSSSLLFGLLLVGYLALSIYTLLLFHFKREMELFERPSPRMRLVAPAPGALREASGTLSAIPDRRFWRISASAGLFALVIGGMLFVSLPRVGEGFLGGPTPPGGSQMTGFTENPRLGDIGRIKESDELVMWVTVRQDGQPKMLNEPLMLRGIASWRYTLDVERGQKLAHWRPLFEELPASRSRSLRLSADQMVVLAPRWTPAEAAGQTEYRIELSPLTSQCLFTPYPMVAFRPESSMGLTHNRLDETLSSQHRLTNGLRYSVWTPRAGVQANLGDAPPRGELRPPRLPRVRQLARQWTEGLPDDAARAAAIEGHLQNDFRYTLDLQPPPGDDDQDEDPLEVFLFRTKAGHCQYFASAMVVMCQQLGMPARMISGFKSVEYNSQGGYYIVRQKHAHSWAEVYLPDRGWTSFDPTPAAGDTSFDTPAGLIGWFQHTLDYMNHKWQQRVLNYSRSDREALLGQTGSAMGRLWDRVRDWGRGIGQTSRGGWALGVLMLAAVAAGVMIVRSRAWQLWRFNRRQRRLRDAGLDFWADLLDLLRRARRLPSPALTPLEVARQLEQRLPQVAHLPDLAEDYYRVRYGRRTLSPAQRDRVRHTLAALRAALLEPTPSPGPAPGSPS